MSWAEEDWTVGLSGRVLQKVKELQVFKERLSRENKQKQLQLDNIHTSLEKQTAKVNTDQSLPQPDIPIPAVKAVSLKSCNTS
uniref:Centromere protein Cenp-F N-terminal domain-containing protein n=1 Tax=Poecilia reticulata TaxID=8081 RepID=A0A3P9PKM7_POERE